MIIEDGFVDVAGNTMFAESSLRRSVKRWMGKLNPNDEVVESAIYSFGNPFSFVIGLGTRLASEAVLNAILSDKNFNRIVAKSGGTAARADGDATTEKLAALLDFLRNRYVVGFAPPQHTAGERFLKLSLKITPQAKKRAGEVAVVTAQGYFARKNDQSGMQSAANEEKNSAGRNGRAGR